ncbi:thiol reductant ABC exporter subunit CydC [Oceanibaculum indicum]|uniref:ATP-binding cassette subfamily C protein CydC n=1 Tax=Oceanibaculum indicum TaxID=526216 RepID=A0A420WP79_9PROT|nr:thiol reductant ABC exporter subunit CydC [Oceanibaculum indicum]RKQ72844.1 ATP-binding cassette subfamily C protein CydC [Oceanibaculum indicum]
MRALRAILGLFWRKDRLWFLIGLALAIVSLVAGIGLLALAGWFIAATALAGAAGLGLAFNFFSPSAGIRFLAILRTAGRYGERLATHEATLRLLANLRVTVFGNLLARDFAQLAQIRGGDFLQRLTGDIDLLDALYLRLAVPLLTALTVIVALVGLLLIFDPWLALGVGALLGLTGILLPALQGYATRRAARRLNAGERALRLRTVDLSRGQVELAMAGRLAAQRDGIAKAHAMAESAALDISRRESLAGASLFVAGQSALAFALWRGAVLLRDGVIDGALLAMILLLVLGATEALGLLRRGLLELGRTILAARRVEPYTKEGDQQPVSSGLVPEGSLRLEGLAFRYAPDRRPVLEGITADISPGEIVALVGPSGSGKSTLLGLVAGMHAPSAGHILIGGQPLDSIAEPDLRRTVGLLGQRTELFRDSIAGNLRLASPEADETILWDALRRAGLEPAVRRLPQGLETVLGDEGSGLSGGERRRLALARLILTDPAIWLLDEPTEGLDRPMAAAVLDDILAAAAGRIVLLATHRPEEAAKAGRLLRLDMAS